MTRIALIVAVASNGVIGRDNALPWRLSTDLKRFKRLTMGHPIIMGRKTHQSIGRPLPGRRNIVLSRNPDYDAPGCEVFNGLAAAREALTEPLAFVIGGAEIYRQAARLADTIYLTRVLADIDGDARFADPTPDEWRLRSIERVAAGARDDYATEFSVYERRAPAQK